MKNLIVKEIFYSIQGEGARQGEASIFVRLSKCNMNCLFCDTDWTGGTSMNMEEILKRCKLFKCDWIVWTGGEPTLQLTEEVISFFKMNGYHQAIETNGTNPVPKGINYIACSPKVEPEVLRENFDFIHEIRYPVGLYPPPIYNLPRAMHYYVSPIFEGEVKKRMNISILNAKRCINFVLSHPEWKLSLQIQKIINIK